MQSKIPLPTDNIYKFYALFGLLIFLSSAYAFTNLYQNYNERSFKRYIDLEVLKSIEVLSPDQVATKKVLEEQRKIDASDKRIFINALSFIFSISLFLMGFGFYRWHSKIQPQQDKTIEKQLEKMELEIRLLNKQLSSTPYKRHMQ